MLSVRKRVISISHERHPRKNKRKTHPVPVVYCNRPNNHLPHAAVAGLFVLVRLDELQLAAFVAPPEVAAGQQQQNDNDAAQCGQAADQHDARHAERTRRAGVRQGGSCGAVCGGGAGAGGATATATGGWRRDARAVLIGAGRVDRVERRRATRAIRRENEGPDGQKKTTNKWPDTIDTWFWIGCVEIVEQKDGRKLLG